MRCLILVSQVARFAGYLYYLREFWIVVKKCVTQDDNFQFI